MHAMSSQRTAVAVNQDFDFFFAARAEDQMTLAGLQAWVDQFAGTHVSHLFLCPNGMRTNYRSTVWEAYWDGVDETRLGASQRRWINNARRLHDTGLDPYATWAARARQHGISPWLSTRMNDVHCTETLDDFHHSRFWQAHPDYWRVPGSVHAYVDRALDYGIPAVREHHLQLIAELLERYDVDGLELDWMRFVCHFRPGHEREGGQLLLPFLQQVRTLAVQAAAKRGHAIRLAARVPTQPQVARALGLDGVAWARAGLVDQLTLAPFYASCDLAIPVDLWRELLGEAGGRVQLAPALDMHLKAYPAASARRLDPESVCGFAAAMIDRGADMIYLFNYPYLHDAPDPDRDERWRAQYNDNLRVLGSAAELGRRPRRHVVTFTDVVAPGTALAAVLPAELSWNRAAPFRIDVGPVSRGPVRLVVGLAERAGVQAATVNAILNSEPGQATADPAVPPRELRPGTGSPQRFNAAVIPGAARLLCFDLPAQALVRGANLVEVTLQSDPPQQAVWVELQIGSGVRC